MARGDIEFAEIDQLGQRIQGIGRNCVANSNRLRDPFGTAVSAD